MTPATFETDNSMPDLMDHFDYGAFLNLPPDDVDQGVEDGQAPWMFDDSGHAFDFMPKLCDERQLDVPVPSALLGPPENVGARQSTNLQLQINNGSPGFGYGASNLYGDEIGASGCVRPASATVLKTTGLETIAMGDCGEVCTIPSDQESSPSLASDLASHEASESHCACISCLKTGTYRGLCQSTDHEKRHYGLPGKYTCLEENCQASTKHFGDLRRHYKNKHCSSPDKEQFPCPVPWCKYSGNNGFARKDKLKSHYRNIHEGKPGPVKAGRVIKPATLKPRVSSVGNSPSKQNE